MSRILFSVQETGGVGKSTIVRALAEAVVDAPVYEIESTSRLLELGERVHHFPIRAQNREIVKTGGQASVAEFDAIVNALVRESRPAIVDVGANGAEALLSVVGRTAPAFARRGKELGILVVASAPDSAMVSLDKLLKLTAPWAAAQFVVANEYRGEVDLGRISTLAPKIPVSTLSKFGFGKGIVSAIEPLGLALIPEIDDEELAKRLPDAGGHPNHSLALMTMAMLAEFRLEAMQAVRRPAEWVIA